MNTFRFNVNKNTVKNNVCNTTNNRSYIDNVIVSNLKKAVPYAFNTSKHYVIDDDYKPTKTVDIDITVKKPRAKKISIDLDFEKYSDFEKAIKRLASYYDEDSYDFVLPDGTPVKIFDDEIQIGYTIIPFKKMTKNIFDELNDTVKKSVIYIYTNISK